MLIDRKLKDYEDLRDDMRGREAEVKRLLDKGKSEQQVGPCLVSFQVPCHVTHALLNLRPPDT